MFQAEAFLLKDIDKLLSSQVKVPKCQWDEYHKKGENVNNPYKTI